MTVRAFATALFGPMLVLGLFWLLLLRFRDADERQAEDNAGMVVNANVVNKGAVAAIDHILATKKPEVIVLGPSYANTDTNTELLAKRIGVRRDDIALLSVPNSVGAHWYAMLKYRVFEAGYRPKLIVVISGLQSMLLNTPLTESSFVNLEVQLPPGTPDPEIALRVKQTTALWWARLREQRSGLRDRVFEVLRDLPARMLFRSPKNSGPLRPDEVRTALDRVFADDRMDPALHAAAGPLVAIDLDERAYDASLLPMPQDSFMPVITRLAAAQGAQVVWVRPPMSPDIPAERDDVVGPGVQEAAVRVVDEVGGHFVDMRGLSMSASQFRNIDHMNKEGSRRFTEALASALVDIDVLGDHALVRSTAYGPHKVELVGERQEVPPSITEFEPAGRLVHPATTLVWHFVAPWPRARGAFAVQVVLAHLGSPPVEPRVSVAGEPVVLRSEPGTEKTVWIGDLSTLPPDGAWDLTVEAPAGGPFYRVTQLRLGRGEGSVTLLGPPEVGGPEAALFSARRVVSGVMEDLSVAPTYSADPVAPPGWDRAIEAAPGPISKFATERWDFLSDERLMGESAFGSRCSPLRVRESDTPLAFPNVPCAEVSRRGEGRSCHGPEAIFFSATDRTDPDVNGRTYTLFLDPGRRCDGAVWLYPKDELTVSWPQDRLLALGEAGATTFRFSARYLQHREATVQLRLLVDDEPRITETLSSRALLAGPMEWPLDPPVKGQVRLEVTNDDYVFYLIDDATLVGPPAPAAK